MIVDTSALIAILFAEAEGAEFSRIIAGSQSPKLSAGSYVECGAVVDGRRIDAVSREVDPLIAALAIRIVPITEGQARIARQAYRDFGRGSGHPAKLNFGDCFSYALAIESGEPLLWKGDDLGHTDVRSAVP